MTTTQIAVRLPDSLVAWIDTQVAEGQSSRADVVRKALIRYRRSVDAEHDAQIYRRTGEDDPELDAWVHWGADHPVDLDG